MDITTIPTEQLQKDLAESREDITVCSTALGVGVENYSGGSVAERLEDNKRFVQMITAELNRRGLTS